MNVIIGQCPHLFPVRPNPNCYQGTVYGRSWTARVRKPQVMFGYAYTNFSTRISKDYYSHREIKLHVTCVLVLTHILILCAYNFSNYMHKTSHSHKHTHIQPRTHACWLLWYDLFFIPMRASCRVHSNDKFVLRMPSSTQSSRRDSRKFLANHLQSLKYNVLRSRYLFVCIMKIWC